MKFEKPQELKKDMESEGKSGPCCNWSPWGCNPHSGKVALADPSKNNWNPFLEVSSKNSQTQIGLMNSLALTI